MLHVYGKHHTESERVRRLVQARYNKHALSDENRRQFEKKTEPAVLQCKTDDIQFLFPSSFSGIERPQIEVLGSAVFAWGSFDYDNTYSFKDGHELPIRYIHPLEDESLKYLIDAGLYSDNRFEELMGKLMCDETFDIETELTYQHVNIGTDVEPLPIVIVDPVHTVDMDNSKEHVTINDLVQRSARLVIELRKEGVSTEDVVAVDHEQESQVIIEDEFKDIIEQEREKQEDIQKEQESENIATKSELLDKEIDITDELQGGLTFNETSEDDLIRDLKTRSSSEVKETPVKQKPKVRPRTYEEYEEQEGVHFEGGLDSFKKQLEQEESHTTRDSGPEL